MKSCFQKQEPIILNYTNYTHLNNENLRNELFHEIGNKGFCDIICKEFEIIFMTILNKHAPMKIKYIRANNCPFMNNELSKAIIVRFKLRNKCLKLKTMESKDAYKKQRNYCLSLLRKV